jgi:ELWxxDGT repeat protein
LTLLVACAAVHGGCAVAGADTLSSTVVVPASMYPSLPVAFEGSAYLSAEEASTGIELYKADLHLDGLGLFKDIGDGGPNTLNHGDGYPGWFAVSGHTLYFLANDLAHGSELWATDGTVAGTRMVKEIRTGADYGSVIAPLMPVPGGIVFRAINDSVREKLWFSDGSEAGTKVLKDIRVLDDSMVSVGSKVLFVGYDTDRAEGQIWSTDGTAAGTKPITDLSSDDGSFPIQVVPAPGGRLYFTRGDFTPRPRELWTIDPDGSITELAETHADWTYPGILHPTVAGGLLYFVQAESEGYGAAELWRTDGTSAGTIELTAFGSNGWASAPRELAAMGDGLIFDAGTAEVGVELWCTDGTRKGTRLLKDIDTAPDNATPKGGSAPRSFREVGNRVYFAASDPVHGRELWQTDGSPEGTVLASDAIPGPAGLDPRESIVIGDQLFHRAGPHYPLVRVALPTPAAAAPRCRAASASPPTTVPPGTTVPNGSTSLTRWPSHKSTAPKVAIVAPKATRLHLSTTALRFTQSFPAPGTVSWRLVLAVSAKRSVHVGSAAKRVRTGQPVAGVLRLSRSARRVLRRYPRAPLTLTTTFTPASGAGAVHVSQRVRRR